ncbi:MAG TPA: hypothetical protein VN700_07775 [Vicinamibacterales bacterium]|nr:hypothetical protein [Vicinamibacterales bacterium]
MPPLQALDFAGAETAVERQRRSNVGEDPVDARLRRQEQALLFLIRQSLADWRFCVLEGAIILFKAVPEAGMTKELPEN